jgi:hypothetical protein
MVVCWSIERDEMFFDYFCLNRGLGGFPSSFCFLDDDGMPLADSMFITFSRAFRRTIVEAFAGADEKQERSKNN